MTRKKLGVALLEPFRKGSHAAWVKGFMANSCHRVELFCLPGIHWKWRMHHGALTFARDLIGSGSPPDVILCTSMVDGAALRGLLPTAFGDIPLVVYFHENQLTYPLAPGEVRDLHYAWGHLTTCLVARWCIFNSTFQRDDFLQALPAFLDSFPDHKPLYALEEIQNKSRILTPGVDIGRYQVAAKNRPARTGPLSILWNHRWEADKEPDDFLDALLSLATGEQYFTVVLAGSGVDRVGEGTRAKIKKLGKRVVHLGYAPEEEYAELVAGCDLVASTSRHDFFGISVVEAMAAGLCPLLPTRQNYPHLIPTPFQAKCLYRDDAEFREKLRGFCQDPARARALGEELPTHTRQYDLTATTAALDDLLLAAQVGN